MAKTLPAEFWVLVNENGLIIGASVADGRPSERTFLDPTNDFERELWKRYTVRRVRGCVYMNTPVSDYVAVPE